VYSEIMLEEVLSANASTNNYRVIVRSRDKRTRSRVSFRFPSYGKQSIERTGIVHVVHDVLDLVNVGCWVRKTEAIPCHNNYVPST
jgi:hypothetical protein